jgi:hypothetical protein
VPLLVTVPGIGWVLAYTIAAEIGDISRFATPTKLTGYTGLCPRVYQSGPIRPALGRAEHDSAGGPPSSHSLPSLGYINAPSFVACSDYGCVKVGA